MEYQENQIQQEPFTASDPNNRSERSNGFGVLIGALLGAGVLGACLLARRSNGGHGDVVPPPGIVIPETSHYYGGRTGCGVILNASQLPITNSSSYPSLSAQESLFSLYDDTEDKTYLLDEAFNMYEVEEQRNNDNLHRSMHVVRKLVAYSTEWQEVIDRLATHNQRDNALTHQGYRTLAAMAFMIGDDRLESDSDDEDVMIDGKKCHMSYFPWPTRSSDGSKIIWLVGSRSIQWFKAKKGSSLSARMGSQLFAQVQYTLPTLGSLTCYVSGTRAQIKRQTKLPHIHTSVSLAEDQADRWSKDNTGFILSKHHKRKAAEQWRSFNRLVSPNLSLSKNFKPYVFSPIDAYLLQQSNVVVGRYSLNRVFDAVDLRRLFEMLKIAPSAVFLFEPDTIQLANSWLEYMFAHTDERINDYLETTQAFPADLVWVGLFGNAELKFADSVSSESRTIFKDLVHKAGAASISSSMSEIR